MVPAASYRASRWTAWACEANAGHSGAFRHSNGQEFMILRAAYLTMRRLSACSLSVVGNGRAFSTTATAVTAADTAAAISPVATATRTGTTVAEEDRICAARCVRLSPVPSRSPNCR